MKKLLILALAAAMAPCALADDVNEKATEVATNPAGLVSVASKGQDVRSVLFDLFSQANKSFVLEPNVRFVLYLNLKEVEFEEALGIILRTSNLTAEKQNGITFIRTKSEKDTPNRPSPTPAPAARPLGKIPAAELQKKVTTRMAMAEIRSVFAELGRQTGLRIEIGKGVPDVKIDAFLIDTSLKFSLDSICDAVGLKYSLTENRSILIEKK